MRSSKRVAVIDIGSNSIKLLIATQSPDGSIQTLAQQTEETRIGAGISGDPPRLDAAAMQRGVEAVQTLLCAAQPFEPCDIAVVATSAVRDAVNGNDFADAVFNACGQELNVLTGEEEARLIGRGIACDPAVAEASTFYLFDLGGGSLEMLAIERGRVVQLASLQLGCVRVTEQCVPQPELPISEVLLHAVRQHVAAVIAGSGFRFDLPIPAQAVVTGGTATTFRVMQAKKSGAHFEDATSEILVTDMERLADQLAAEPMASRRQHAGLPAARADVMPAALITLVEVARLVGVAAYQHSLYNLRYGLAAEMLKGSAIL